MWYSRNLPRWERGLRVLAGLGLLAWGLLAQAGTARGYGLAAAGALTVLSGFVGFCPMCALVGRRLGGPK